KVQNKGRNPKVKNHEKIEENSENAFKVKNAVKHSKESEKDLKKKNI
ncbi:18309_t:CDS:1, partial [Funneliformis geosporum]